MATAGANPLWMASTPALMHCSMLSSSLTRCSALVVAAGPSLDRNVHDLAPALDRTLVIACDTAARPLLTLGVEPDLIVAADSGRANAAYLSLLPPSRSWLVGEGSLHPSAFVHFDQRLFTFAVADHHPWPWLCTAGLDCTTLGTCRADATVARTPPSSEVGRPTR
jgi:hypothetical protein